MKNGVLYPLLLLFLCVFFVQLLLPTPALAWKPTRPITVIVAYKAGSGTDTGARILLQHAKNAIGQKLLVKNLPGLDGKIGWTELARSEPDGYTIGFINLPSFTTISEAPNSPFSVSSIVPIANHLTETCVIVVKASSPWKTLTDLVAACRERPGIYRCSTNGQHASNHIGVQLLANSANFRYKAIPYGGTADQLAALRSDEVHFSCAKVADVARFATGPRAIYRILGVFATKRLAILPDVPTLGELGFYDKWYGSARSLVAPAGTPHEIIAFYEEAFKKTMEDPKCIAAHAKAGMSIDYKNSAELGKLIESQLEFSRHATDTLFP